MLGATEVNGQFVTAFDGPSGACWQFMATPGIAGCTPLPLSFAPPAATISYAPDGVGSIYFPDSVNRAIVSVWCDSNGSCAPPVSSPTGTLSPLSVAPGYFMGPGAAVQVAAFGTLPGGKPGVSIFWGDGISPFSGTVAVPGVAADATRIAVGDMNGDGFADVIVTANGREDIILTLSPGVFDTVVSFPVTFGPPTVVAVGDVNGDGVPDIIVASGTNYNLFTNHVSVLTGNPVTLDSGASFAADQPVAPDQILTLFTPLGAPATLPPSGALTTLGGVKATVTDSNGNAQPAWFYYVGPGQANLMMPPGMAPEKGNFNLTVSTTSGVTRFTDKVTIAATSPGLFSANANGTGVAAANLLRIKANGTRSNEVVAQYDATSGKSLPTPIVFGAGDQLYISFYGTGVRHNAGLSSVSVLTGTTALPVVRTNGINSNPVSLTFQ